MLGQLCIHFKILNLEKQIPFYFLCFIPVLLKVVRDFILPKGMYLWHLCIISCVFTLHMLCAHFHTWVNKYLLWKSEKEKVLSSKSRRKLKTVPRSWPHATTSYSRQPTLLATNLPHIFSSSQTSLFVPWLHPNAPDPEIDFTLYNRFPFPSVPVCTRCLGESNVGNEETAWKHKNKFTLPGISCIF